MNKENFDLEPFGFNQTRRETVQSAEEILYKPVECLDHGFVRLVDYSGGDSAIVQAARVSYGKGTKHTSEDRGLIRYLMRHRHTTPFEMVELKFHAKMPIFVARQWIRHRTASVNEYSGRYSVLGSDFYVPEPTDLAVQSTTNRQGRADLVTPEEATRIMGILETEAQRDYKTYTGLLNEDPDKPGNPIDPEKSMLSRELARMGLGLNFYTEWYWKTDLHNLFHFLGLRKDPHAQKEIRVFADAMGEMTKRVAPFAYEAFEDYQLNGMRLSDLDIRAIGRIMAGEKIGKVTEEVFSNKRERTEFLEKYEQFKGNSDSS